ncbi:MAG: V-type ATP synthase subunit F [Candidatus Bathyarchaeia archaeon]|nr:hypothetical protein [Candidatus Bathyarchaeota archaeon]
MSSIAIIADKDTATLFKLAGLKFSLIANSPEEAEKTLKMLMEKRLAAVIITKNLAQQIQQTISSLKRGRKYPIIVTIPGVGEPIEKEVVTIHEYLKRSLGIELKAEER